MPGFPNFWMLEGPTGPVGNISLVMVIAPQSRNDLVHRWLRQLVSGSQPRPQIYPWTPARYRREMKRPDFAEFRLMASEEQLRGGKVEATIVKCPPPVAMLDSAQKAPSGVT